MIPKVQVLAMGESSITNTGCRKVKFEKGAFHQLTFEGTSNNLLTKNFTNWKANAEVAFNDLDDLQESLENQK